jgi:ribosome maturation factor RimP
MADIAAIAALVEPEAKALGFDLVRVRLQGGDDVTLQIMAERPETGQLTIDDCTALSHRLSDLFDRLEEEGRDPMDEPYRLEVSSPGIDRPLTRLKDFADWIGHEARVVLTTGVVPPPETMLGDGARKNLSGELLAVEGTHVTIRDRKAGPMTFAFADLADAKLILTDALIAATRPLDSSGADEFEDADASASED